MAGRLIRRFALGCVVLALLACEQSATKPDAEPPDLAKIYAEAATAYEEQDWAQSEKLYTILARQAPGEAEPWFKLGNVYARTQRPDLAVKSYREALIRDPQNVKAWHNMGIVQLREASSTFSEVQLLLKPDDDLYDKSVNIQKTIGELVN